MARERGERRVVHSPLAAAAVDEHRAFVARIAEGEARGGDRDALPRRRDSLDPKGDVPIPKSGTVEALLRAPAACGPEPQRHEKRRGRRFGRHVSRSARGQHPPKLIPRVCPDFGYIRTVPMSLRFHNTLTQKLENFEPLVPGTARIYLCGLTTYNVAHAGHARTMTTFDVLVRHLRARGLKDTYVRNVTDVDDKILKKSKEVGQIFLQIYAFIIQLHMSHRVFKQNDHIFHTICSALEIYYHFICSFFYTFSNSHSYPLFFSVHKPTQQVSFNL